jgi:hypothetical protein
VSNGWVVSLSNPDKRDHGRRDDAPRR